MILFSYPHGKIITFFVQAIAVPTFCLLLFITLAPWFLNFLLFPCFCLTRDPSWKPYRPGSPVSQSQALCLVTRTSDLPKKGGFEALRGEGFSGSICICCKTPRICLSGISLVSNTFWHSWLRLEHLIWSMLYRTGECHADTHRWLVFWLMRSLVSYAMERKTERETNLWYGFIRNIHKFGSASISS